MFAPALHPAMAKVMPTRRALGIRTVFNILGPLTNPARPKFQLVGVAARNSPSVVAGALAELGVERAIVVHGAGGADELTCAGDCIAIFVRTARSIAASCTRATPVSTRARSTRCAAGRRSENAQTLRETLEGKPGPIADCVLFNAGAALDRGRTGDRRSATGSTRRAM